MALVLSATIASLFVVGRLSAVTGFVLTGLLGARRGRGGHLRPTRSGWPSCWPSSWCWPRCSAGRCAAARGVRSCSADLGADRARSGAGRPRSSRPRRAAVVALTAAVALVLVLSRAVWPYTRMLVTITHEGGHAVAALLAGRRLQGIRLHSDTSGLTVSSGRPSGPGHGGDAAGRLPGAGGGRAGGGRRC